ncbi:MAG: hypothetical protein M0021_00040 [Clostridia bacterium]|nr:hypothetical protein [Clostridia bacterium]
MKCTGCQLCGKQGEADLLCTWVLEEENKVDRACWCVCPECHQDFHDKIHKVYADQLGQ